MASAPSPRRAIPRWVAGTLSGRTLAAGAALKIVAVLLRLTLGSFTPIAFLDTLADITLVVGALVLGYRLFVQLKRALLWRVRSKLTLSYIFIGFVPALLIILFFVMCGLLLFFNVSAYALLARMAALTDQTQFLAESTAIGVQAASTQAELVTALERRRAAAVTRYPLVSLAVVPASARCSASGQAESRPAAPSMLTAGPWTHVPAPTSVPEWVPCSGYSGLITYSDGARTQMVARAVAFAGTAMPQRAVIVDVPLTADVVKQIQQDAGVEIEDVTSIGPNGTAPTPQTDTPIRVRIGVGGAQLPGQVRDAGQQGLPWVAFTGDVDWATGDAGRLLVSFRMSPSAVYDRISGGFTGIGDSQGFTFGQMLLLLLTFVGCLFLVIQIVAYVMGFALARSITGSIHELFAGTERVRRGDFAHRIAIRSRDQLGELAESFNSMTTSIADLLQQKAEKERLEQELRIARSIQMSLLPQRVLAMPGLSLAAHCEPAREVGGDYFDYLPIDEHRLGLLIADVAGKGTSAALYMAELKGLMLSLSRHHTSPRRLLIEANQIIARHLDTRSFITITYAVVDLEARTFTYARAGHCPLIYVPGPYAAARDAQILTPDGLVLGLQIDDGTLFDRMLEEVSLPIGGGDLFVLYTDGITEAMNAAGDCYGESRLARLAREHADLPFDELRERILREVRAFAGATAQQDDITMLLLRAEDVAATVP
jgi:sigma-B regulation protein RsbU (phosphoserine phosphatase)